MNKSLLTWFVYFATIALLTLAMNEFNSNAKATAEEVKLLQARVEAIESSLHRIRLDLTQRKASTPRIEVQRATIYATDGEIVIKTAPGRKKEKKEKK